MSSRLRPILAIAAALSLAACTGGTTTPPAASAGGGGGAATCTVSTNPGTVQAAMAGRAFTPSTIQAKVGDVIAWTNNDTLPHTATVKDDPTCTTDTLSTGKSGALTFSAAGTYAFFCKIHSDMTGTIEITE
jgi:plastocyanin